MTDTRHTIEINITHHHITNAIIPLLKIEYNKSIDIFITQSLDEKRFHRSNSHECVV